MQSLPAVAGAYLLTICVIGVSFPFFVAFLDGQPPLAWEYFPMLAVYTSVFAAFLALPGFIVMRSALYVLSQNSAGSFFIGSALNAIFTLVLLPQVFLWSIAANDAGVDALLERAGWQQVDLTHAALSALKVGVFGGVMGLVYHWLERRFSGGLTPKKRTALQ